MNTSLSAELRCRADLGLEEMDESHWMKFTNTRHLSSLVMYKYPNYCLLSFCYFSSFITYILTGTLMLQFCSFACFSHFPMAHHPYCTLFSIIFGLLLPGTSFIYGRHINIFQGFCSFVLFSFVMSFAHLVERHIFNCFFFLKTTDFGLNVFKLF